MTRTQRLIGTLLTLALAGTALVGLPEPAMGSVSGLAGGAPSVAPGDPVVAAAGDIACDPASSAFRGGTGTSTACHQAYTGALLSSGDFAAILALGDEQYDCGGYQAFTQSYDLAWGSVKDLTYPAVGNHEYDSSGGTDCASGAAGYFQYFGSAAGDPSKGYYSVDIGAWHLIALNSNCTFVSCASGSTQERWLATDLANHPASCTLAFFHHPRFASGKSKVLTAAKVLPFWNDLYAAHADLVLNGHKHFYERFAQLDPGGAADPNGIREFIVGTGGKNHGQANVFRSGSEFHDTTDFGVLELTLGEAGYAWAFVNESGTVVDSGGGSCVA